jgi:hypothetical protein
VPTGPDDTAPADDTSLLDELNEAAAASDQPSDPAPEESGTEAENEL